MVVDTQFLLVKTIKLNLKTQEKSYENWETDI